MGGKESSFSKKCVVWALCWSAEVKILDRSEKRTKIGSKAQSNKQERPNSSKAGSGSELKLNRSKKKPYLNMIQKRWRFLWAKAHLKWTVAKWKTVLWSDESKFEVLFGKLGRHVIQTKEDKDNPSCYQRSVQKPASLMVWGCMSACGMGSLHIWKGTINAERYIQVLEQHMLPSRRRLFQGRPCIFQHDNARPHTASITTSWLRRRRIRVLKWPACSPDLSP